MVPVRNLELMFQGYLRLMKKQLFNKHLRLLMPLAGKKYEYKKRHMQNAGLQIRQPAYFILHYQL